MKSMKLLSVIFLLAISLGCQAKQTILKGRIRPYNGEKVIVWSYEADFRDTLQVNASGKFSWSPKLAGDQIYIVSILDYEPRGIEINLMAGEQAGLDLTLLPHKKVNAKFSGDRAAENEYRMIFNKLKTLGIRDEPETKTLSYTAYKANMEEIEKNAQATLNRVEDLKVKNEFAKQQHLYFQGRLVEYSSLLIQRARAGIEASDADFSAFLQTLNVNDPNECTTYIIGDIIRWKLIQDPAYKEEESNIRYLTELDRLVSNPEIKNEFATTHMQIWLKHASGENLDGELKLYKQICTNDVMRKQIDEQYQEYLRAYNNLTPGKPAPDFELIDDKGKKCRLSDLKGTYVFVDVWATWCHGCVMEIPHMEKLQEHFANDKRITLISISWDYTQKVWLDYLKKHPATWPQYIVDKENKAVMQKEYRMSWIPRFMLIDPEGRLISIDYERPSHRECVKRLEKDINSHEIFSYCITGVAVPTSIVGE